MKLKGNFCNKPYKSQMISPSFLINHFEQYLVSVVQVFSSVVLFVFIMSFPVALPDQHFLFIFVVAESEEWRCNVTKIAIKVVKPTWDCTIVKINRGSRK